MRGRRILIPLPNTGALTRRRHYNYMRCCVIFLILMFGLFQFLVINDKQYSQHTIPDTNSSDNTETILSMVPSVYHKYLIGKNREQPIKLVDHTINGHNKNATEQRHQLNITEIQRLIARYNSMQTVLNEDIFGPLQNDSVIIVIQVHTRINYLRHLIVSLAQAKGIANSLLIFSHDVYDEEINDLVQSIDFCKVMQIFYPYSIQTHPDEFPGADPSDCPRNIKKQQALILNCNNAQHPDLYGHYREATFTQTKHHWWWKTNFVFQLDMLRHHTGLVLFLEEDHYVAEDFIQLLDMMHKQTTKLCPKCNVFSLGTYLKTFNYYTYNTINNKALFDNIKSTGNSNANIKITNVQTNDGTNGISFLSGLHADLKQFAQASRYQVSPTLYSPYQKVEITPWTSSKHNMGFAFSQKTWHEIIQCASYFCNYDDYNWDWSLQHVSQQCLKDKLKAMVLKGPRVFHIGECGVHHKKKNCESNQVLTKVQKILSITKNAGQLYPKSLSVVMASATKKQKLRKGNGGWGDIRDHQLCQNMTMPVR